MRDTVLVAGADGDDLVLLLFDAQNPVVHGQKRLGARAWRGRRD
jgi:hypothetical protein